MRRMKRDSGYNDGTLEAVLVIALVSAAASLLILNFGPTEARDTTLVVAPAIAAAVTGAITTRKLVVRRLVGSLRSNRRKLLQMQTKLEDEQAERTALRDFIRALDEASDERSVLTVAEEAFGRHLAPQSTELHLVHRVDPILGLAFSTGEHRPLDDERPSPWTSLAGRTSSTLVYDTTTGPDICPHLAGRLDAPVSAIAVPLVVAGGLLGVLYTFGPVGQHPGSHDVVWVEDFAGALAGRLAVVRSTSERTTDDRIDRLTGLPDRSTTQRKLLSMIDEQRSFTIAVADIDDLGRINDVAGREIGDRALEILAATARRAVRPIDIVGRIGGDELLFIFPDTAPDDAVKALERLREELFLTQSTTQVAAFTLSIGVIGSSYGGPIDKILIRAADALRYAKSGGGNRVVLAPKVEAEQST